VREVIWHGVETSRTCIVPRPGAGRPSERLFRARARALDERLIAFSAPRCCLHRGPALRSGRAPIRERERAWTPRERSRCVRREFCFSVFFGCSGTVGWFYQAVTPSLKLVSFVYMYMPGRG
jgi:hypothetical protein